MTGKLFPTQEIGSLAKPSWLVSALKGLSPSSSEIAEMERWAKELGVRDSDELRGILTSPQRLGERSLLRDWASLFGIRLLERAGLDIVYDGEARRVEMYEYPVRNISGFKFCGLVRSFDNRYYRKAACVDQVSCPTPYHVEEFSFVRRNTDRTVKVPITGPYTLADWSFNEYYQAKLRPTVSDLRRRKLEAKREFVLDLASRVIRPNIKRLEESGAEWVQIDEPAATTHPEEVELFVEAFNEATNGVGCKISVHICFSDYSLLYPHVLEMRRCSQFAWEFANRDNGDRAGYQPLRLLAEYADGREMGLGVADVHVDTVESPELVRDRILYAAKIVGDPDRIYVNPDCGLRTRTWEIAYAKLRNMVRGAELAREAYAGEK